MHETHGRLATLMFVQVTEVIANNKEVPVAQARLDTLQKSLSIYLKHYRGELVEISSGEIFAWFPGAALAFNAATGLPVLMPQFCLRTGLHIGEVLVRREKLQGTAVNLAARLPFCSRAGGICLSQTVFQYLGADERQKLVPIGHHDLKNFDMPLPLYACLPEGQIGRNKTRELQHRLIVKLNLFLRQLGFKYLFLLFLFGLALLLSWQLLSSSTPSDEKRIIVRLPEFVKLGSGEQSIQLLDSIEATVRAQLAGVHEDLRLILADDSAEADTELRVSLSVVSGEIQSDYILRSLSDERVLVSGVLESGADDIFQFQDALSRKILLDIRKQ